MGLRVGKLRKKVFCVNKIPNTVGVDGRKFSGLDRIAALVKKGDIMEIICAGRRHTVLVDKVVGPDEIWCFYVRQIADSGQSFGCLGIVKHQPVGELVAEMMGKKAGGGGGSALFRVNNQSELAAEVLGRTQNSTPDPTRLVETLMAHRNSFVRYDERLCNGEHYATLWKYGIGWSRARNTGKNILRAIGKFRTSFSAKCAFGTHLNGQCFIDLDCSVIIYCYGLYDSKLIDGIDYVMRMHRAVKF